MFKGRGVPSALSSKFRGWKVGQSTEKAPPEGAAADLRQRYVLRTKRDADMLLGGRKAARSWLFPTSEDELGARHSLRFAS